MKNAVHVSDEAALGEEHELMGQVLCRDCGVWMDQCRVALTVPGDGGYCATCATPTKDPR